MNITEGEIFLRRVLYTKTILFAATAIFLLSYQTAKASLQIVEVKTLDSDPSATASMLNIKLFGEITEQDAIATSYAIDYMSKLTKKPIILIAELDSPGGDITSAIKIGRLLRAHQSLAVVNHNDSCGSACVLILAGAVGRIVKGTVLIHRPYLPGDQVTSPELQKKKYLELRREVGQYLEEVNIPVSLYDDMLRISPDDAKALTDAELLRYGLSANDPYYDEANDVELAQKRGISREEYAQRKARAKSVCGKMKPSNLNDPRLDKWIQCQDDIMNGK